MALIFAPTTAPMGDWAGVFQQPKPPPSSPRPSDISDATSLTRVDSSHSSGSRSEHRQSKSLRNMFSKSSSKKQTYNPPPIPEIGALADRLPYNDGPRHRVELTPTELSDDISISRTSTNGGSSVSDGASFIDSPTGAHPPQMSEKLARVFGTKPPLAGPKAGRMHPQGEEKPPSRKRDSFLAAMPKRSLERPPTSAGPPTISLPLAAPPAKWEPPPFFKGLSGAVKHGSLMTCGVTANAVIYLSTHDKAGKNVAALGFGSDPVKADKAKEKHRQRVVETLGKAEWSRKIFVLTSAGYLLQFSCDGAFNRLPELSIRLSRHSVAFASDVIPGRHWVIQITTVYDGLSAITAGELSATPAPPAKQRPGSKSTYVKPIKQFLLILDNGEDLDTWLTAVRHEIDVLGGKASSETPATNNLELSRSPLSETTNAVPIPSPVNEPLYSPHSDDTNDNNDPLPWETDERTANLPPWPADEQTPQPSRATNTLSSVPSTKSIEEHLLDSLRDSNTYSQPRSSGGRTFFTSPSASRNSSPTRSPIYESFPPAHTAEDEEGRYGFGEFGQQQQHHQQQRPNAANIRERRQSAQGARPPALDAIIAATTTPPLPPTTPPNDPSQPPRRPSRRTPPTAVKTRLSIVEDQPSPAMLSDELMDEISAPAISPKSRARRQMQRGAPAMPIPPPRSGKRTSSLPSARGAGGASLPMSQGMGSSPTEGEGESDDEFQFHHWTSRLSPPPRAHTPTSPSFGMAELAHSSSSEHIAGLGAPPPLPLFSYPFPPSTSSSPAPTEDPSFSDPSLSPRPLVIAPHTARANAKAQAARDKRVSINGAPGAGIGLGLGAGAGRERRTSIGRPGEGGKRISIARSSGSGGADGREKRDSIVVMRERRVPPKPLNSRGFIAVPADGGASGYTGSGGASSAPGGYATYGAGGGGGGGFASYGAGGGGGYGTYGGVAGGVTTGRVVKAVDRMVIRERGASIGNSYGERSPTALRSPPALKSPTFPIMMAQGGGERPVTRGDGG
ncbi:hypothetical protein V499_05778, partial [Pseudogymnoascus sp. VKM F-103]